MKLTEAYIKKVGRKLADAPNGYSLWVYSMTGERRELQEMHFLMRPSTQASYLADYSKPNMKVDIDTLAINYQFLSKEV